MNNSRKTWFREGFKKEVGLKWLKWSKLDFKGMFFCGFCPHPDTPRHPNVNKSTFFLTLPLLINWLIQKNLELISKVSRTWKPGVFNYPVVHVLLELCISGASRIKWNSCFADALERDFVKMDTKLSINYCLIIFI